METNELIEALLKEPYCIIDILPKRVPCESMGQYFAVERFFLAPERLREIRKKQAELLLKLNCYYDMRASVDAGETWSMNPDPEGFALELASLSNGKTARILFPEQETMIDLDGCDTYMTVYHPSDEMRDLLGRIAGAEGLFLWE